MVKMLCTPVKLMTTLLAVVSTVVLLPQCLGKPQQGRPDHPGGGGEEGSGEIRKCLSNLHVSHAGDRSIGLRWTYQCQEGSTPVRPRSIKYKVYYKHEQFLACPGMVSDTATTGRGKGPAWGNLEVFDVEEVVVPALHPFSRYQVTVKAIHPALDGTGQKRPPEELTVEAKTISSAPDALPRLSTIDPRTEPNFLKFFWREPAPSECHLFNGQLDGYRYILKGVDPWNVADEVHGQTSNLNVEFSDLQPMSSYILMVYSVTVTGTTGPLALKIEAKTKPANFPKAPPRDLKVACSVPSNGGTRTCHLTWLPPYPPTTAIMKYKVRWKPDTSEYWMKGVDVKPGSELCSSPGPDAVEQNPHDLRVCHTLVFQAEDQWAEDTVFQVAAVSTMGSDNLSPWSSQVTATREGPAASSGTLVVVVAVIVSILVVFCIILMVICLRFRVLRGGWARGGHQSGSTFFNNNKSNSLQGGGASTNYPPIIKGSTGGSRASGPDDWDPTSRLSLMSNQTRSTTTAAYTDVPPWKSPKPPPSSIQGLPLPPVPPREPIYEELTPELLRRREGPRGGRRPSFAGSPLPDEEGQRLLIVHGPQGGGSRSLMDLNRPRDGAAVEGTLAVNFVKKRPMDSEDDFLRPNAVTATVGSDDEGGEYLAPSSALRDSGSAGGGQPTDPTACSPRTPLQTPRSAGGRNGRGRGHDDDEEEDEYLKPTFNQFTQINPRDLSPPTENPPPIPIESYSTMESTSSGKI